MIFKETSHCVRGRVMMLCEASKCLTESHINLDVPKDALFRYSQHITHVWTLCRWWIQRSQRNSTIWGSFMSALHRVFNFIFFLPEKKKFSHFFHKPPQKNYSFFWLQSYFSLKDKMSLISDQFSSSIKKLLFFERRNWSLVTWKKQKSVDWQTIIIAFYRYTKKKINWNRKKKELALSRILFAGAVGWDISCVQFSAFTESEWNTFYEGRGFDSHTSVR